MDVAISINGVPVRLTNERWKHITMGHPEIAPFYYEILDTVENPDIIYEGNNGAKIAVKKLRETFAKFVTVVYKEISDQDGFIITTYFSKDTPRLKKKRIVWKPRH